MIFMIFLILVERRLFGLGGSGKLSNEKEIEFIKINNNNNNIIILVTHI